MKTEFYIYIHRRSTDGRVFYVGKGCGARLSSRSKRNKYWHNIVNKHGFTAHIVMRFKREECAFSFERALIKHYGRENLCNLTDGGEGASGAVRSEEYKRSMSESRMGDKHHNYGKRHKPSTIIAMMGHGVNRDIFNFTHPTHGDVSCTMYELRKRYGIDQGNLSAMVSGRYSHVKGWRLK